MNGDYGININLRPGITVTPVHHLGKYPPRLEREHFSGGVNISAQERNRETMSKACVFYTMEGRPHEIFCAPWIADEIRKQVQIASERARLVYR